jgi:hypothetical protein
MDGIHFMTKTLGKVKTGMGLQVLVTAVLSSRVAGCGRQLIYYKKLPKPSQLNSGFKPKIRHE